MSTINGERGRLLIVGGSLRVETGRRVPLAFHVRAFGRADAECVRGLVDVVPVRSLGLDQLVFAPCKANEFELAGVTIAIRVLLRLRGTSLLAAVHVIRDGCDRLGAVTFCVFGVAIVPREVLGLVQLPFGAAEQLVGVFSGLPPSHFAAKARILNLFGQIGMLNLPIRDIDGVGLCIAGVEAVRGAGFLQCVGTIRKVGDFELAGLRILIRQRAGCLGGRVGNGANHRLVVEHCVLHRGTTGTILHVCAGRRAAGGSTVVHVGVAFQRHHASAVERVSTTGIRAIERSVSTPSGLIPTNSEDGIRRHYRINGVGDIFATPTCGGHLLSVRLVAIVRRPISVGVLPFQEQLLTVVLVEVTLHLEIYSGSRRSRLRHLDLQGGLLSVALLGGGDGHIA